MNRLKAAALVIGLLPIAAMATPACAAATESFNWSLSGPAASLGGFPLVESGELTATALGAGVWAVDTLTLNSGVGAALTTFRGADDLIYTNGFAFLDTQGLSFETATGQDVNIFSFFSQGSVPTGNAYGELASPGGFGVGTFTVSAAPEPSTWLLMFAGFGGIGLMLRQTKRKLGLRLKSAVAA